MRWEPPDLPLQTAASEAALKLVTMMRDSSLPATVQLSAVVQVLDRSAASELEERVAELESHHNIDDAEHTERL
jgi:hypothetical protein